jgi:hypothetical protein
MRGKHGNAAKNRQERAELERQAKTAEHRAEQLEKELSELRDSSQRRINSLRTLLAQAVKEREAGTGLALAQAEARIRSLTAQRDEARKQQATNLERWNAIFRNLKSVLNGMGLSNTEAIETLLASATDGQITTLTTGIQGRYGQSDEEAEKIRRIQQARGERSHTKASHE